MRTLLDRVRTRVAPALLTAAGIALTAAGLLTYTVPGPADADGNGLPTPSPTDAGSSSLGLLTFPPVTTGPSETPGTRVATRVVIPALDIDLPIVKPPVGFPYCDVAMYLSIFSQPGMPGVTYLFAHARTGMFLPLLTRSMRADGGASMIGMKVEVYTSDDQVFLYDVFKVRRHYPASGTLQDLPTKDGQLWLQTSEGPYASSTKLQVVANYVSNTLASYADAHPKPHPLVCA